MSKQEKSNSKFFTNHITNTLFDKFKGIIEGMFGLHSFHAVVVYFHSSGHKIRSEFDKGVNPPMIQILILIRKITNPSILQPLQPKICIMALEAKIAPMAFARYNLTLPKSH